MPQREETLPPRRRWTLRGIAALALAILAVAAAVFFGLGRWLVVQDPLEKAQAIVVLSGRMPMRAVEAARIYGAGFATQGWLTRPEQPAAELQSMGLSYAGEEVYNARVLEHEGVPVNAIRVLSPAIE